MTTRMSAFVSRLLAAVLLVGVIGLFAGTVYLSVQKRYNNNAAALTQNMARLSRLKEVLRTAKALQSGYKGGGVDQYKADFLIGTRDASMVAKLQTRLRAMVVGNRSRLNSARALPPKTIGALTYLGLRLQLRGLPRNIHKIIHLIETSSPLLTIDRAVLRLERGRRLAGQVVPNLVADLDIYGAKWPAYRRSPAKDKRP